MILQLLRLSQQKPKYAVIQQTKLIPLGTTERLEVDDTLPMSLVAVHVYSAMSPSLVSCTQSVNVTSPTWDNTHRSSPVMSASFLYLSNKQKYCFMLVKKLHKPLNEMKCQSAIMS